MPHTGILALLPFHASPNTPSPYYFPPIVQATVDVWCSCWFLGEGSLVKGCLQRDEYRGVRKLASSGARVKVVKQYMIYGSCDSVYPRVKEYKVHTVQQLFIYLLLWIFVTCIVCRVILTASKPSVCISMFFLCWFVWQQVCKKREKGGIIWGRRAVADEEYFIFQQLCTNPPAVG